MSTPALTHDAVSHVMWFMDPVDIVRCGRVNRAWRTASQSRMLWARLCASESIVPIVGDSYQTAYLYAACGAFRAHRFALVEAEMARLKNGPWHLQMSTLTRDVPLMLQSAANYFRGVELSQGMLNAKRRAFGDDPNEMALLRRIQLVSDSGAQWGGHATTSHVVMAITTVDGATIVVENIERRSNEFRAPCAMFARSHELFLRHGGRRMTPDAGLSAATWDGVRNVEPAFPLVWNNADEGAVCVSNTNAEVLRRATGFEGNVLTFLCALGAVGSACA